MFKPEKALNTSLFAEKVEMARAQSRNASNGFSDLLKTSWVKSALILGIVFAAISVIIILLVRLFNIGASPLFSNAEAFVAQYGLTGIFFATILAGTVLPLGSPALVTAAALLGAPKFPLVFIAATGFTIGMMINYGLAYGLGRPYVMRKVSAEKLEEVMRLWNRWGWVLYTIFGFIPVLPVELLSLVCGLLRTPLRIFLALSFIPRLVVFATLAFFGEYLGVWIGIS